MSREVPVTVHTLTNEECSKMERAEEKTLAIIGESVDNEVMYV